jgi:hypothetical protein
MHQHTPAILTTDPDSESEEIFRSVRCRIQVSSAGGQRAGAPTDSLSPGRRLARLPGGRGEAWAASESASFKAPCQ